MKKLFICLTLVTFLAGGILNSYQVKAQSTVQKAQTVKVQNDKDPQQAKDNNTGTLTPATPATTAPAATTTQPGSTTTTTANPAKPAGCPSTCPMKANCDPVKAGCPHATPGCCKAKTPPKK
jgi:hypothetical protein